LSRQSRQFVALERASAIQALHQLTRSREDRAPIVYVAILQAIDESPNGGLSIRLPTVNGEPKLLESIGVKCGLLHSMRQPRWCAVYRHPEEDVTDEVTVYLPDRPPKRKSLHGPTGIRRYVLASSTRISKEETHMARTTRKSRSTATRKPAAQVDIDELEELEELEEIEVDEAPAPKRTRSRKAAQPEPEPEDDDDDEDEDESDFAGMTLKELRAAAKAAGIASRGLSKDDLVEALENAPDEDEEDEDEDDDEIEDEEPAPKRRTRTKAATPAANKQRKAAPSNKSTTTKRTPPPARELPKGKVGVEQVAELAGKTGRDVRVWLRKNGDEGMKTEGRWAFTAKQAATIAKRIKSGK